MLTVSINDALKWQPASIQFDVTLDSLPFEAQTDGFEVVAQFRAP